MYEPLESHDRIAELTALDDVLSYSDAKQEHNAYLGLLDKFNKDPSEIHGQDLALRVAAAHNYWATPMRKLPKGIDELAEVYTHPVLHLDVEGEVNYLTTDPFDFYNDIMQRYPVQPQSVQRRLIRQIQKDEDKGAINLISLTNIRMIRHKLKEWKYTVRREFFVDTIQEGIKGILEAVHRFDLEYRTEAKTTHFLTYADSYMRKNIRKYLSTRNDKVHVPLHVKNYDTKMKKIEEEHGMQLTPETIDYFVDCTDFTPHNLRSILAQRNAQVFVAGQTDDLDGNPATMDSHESPFHGDPSACIEESDLQLTVSDKVERCLQELAVDDPLGALVLRYEYGIGRQQLPMNKATPLINKELGGTPKAYHTIRERKSRAKKQFLEIAEHRGLETLA